MLCKWTFELDLDLDVSGKKTMLYYDMDDYRLRLIDERKKIEELLKAGKPVVSRH